MAVASGLASCATGSDTGGSVRLPAAYCGLTGLKVSGKACLPTDGNNAFISNLGYTRSNDKEHADLALMFSVMKGIDGRKIEADMMNGDGLFNIQMNIFKRLRIWHY